MARPSHGLSKLAGSLGLTVCEVEGGRRVSPPARTVQCLPINASACAALPNYLFGVSPVTCCSANLSANSGSALTMAFRNRVM
jgi:hypothetical protein